MVTGDNLQTAKAIAEECGICTEGGIAIEGKIFRAMTIEEQYNVIPSIDVKLKPYFSSLLSLSYKKLPLFFWG
jgi:magnesium-transporting ATPase (P-type)